jgi:hypothetical protein
MQTAAALNMAQCEAIFEKGTLSLEEPALPAIKSMSAMFVDDDSAEFRRGYKGAYDASLSTPNWLPYYNTYRCWHPIHYEYTEDKASQAFRIVKMLMAKKLANVHSVRSFVNIMDELIKVL